MHDAGINDYHLPCLTLLVFTLFVLLFEVTAAIPETLCGRVNNGKGGPIDVDDNLAVPVGSGLLLRVLLAAFFPHLIL